MVPSRENRPSTANTMLLVIKPRPVDFSPNSNHFMGSENEREAWRKNRVMQMKLRAYVTEVQLQQQSSARLLKTEEYRFLQEAMRRSGVPRSVNMLDQLHFYRDKTFPGRRFSTDWHFRDGYHAHQHRHPPPMSARPIRPQRQTPLLNRPKTSATLYRKKIEEDENEPRVQSKRPPYVVQSNLNTNYEILIDSNGRHVASVATEQKLEHNTTNPTALRDTELPRIKIKDNNINKENVQPLDNFKDHPVNLPREITQPSTFTKNDCGDREIRTAPQIIDRNNNNFSSQCPKASESTPPRQRRGSARINSFTEPVPLDNAYKDVNNNLLPDQTDPFASSLTGEELEKEIKNIRVNEFLEKHAIQESQIKHLQHQQQQQQQQNKSNQQELDNEVLNQGISVQLLESKLVEVHVEEVAAEETGSPDGPSSQEEPNTVKPQKRLIRQNTKTNFNRISKNEPAPLRHNITSVLRQERTKFEASQKKVKDYLHTMGGSKDNSTKHSTVTSREPSAHSRRSAFRKSTPNA